MLWSPFNITQQIFVEFPEDSRISTTLIRKKKLTNNYYKAWVSLMNLMES